MNPKFLFIAFLLALSTASSVGCGSSSVPTVDAAVVKAKMKWLGVVYSRYLIDHNGAAPADEAAFRAYLEKQLPELAQFNIKTVDDLLKASRDGEALVVIYGKKIPLVGTPELHVAAYEKLGVEGNRWLCDTRGGIADLSAEQFAEQIPVK